MRRLFRQALRDVMGELEVGLNRSREKDAAGWVFVVIDDESDSHVHVVGPFDTPEAALIASEQQRAEDARMNPGERLWTHHILPMFAPEEER